jgi:hypothetical protein
MAAKGDEIRSEGLTLKILELEPSDGTETSEIPFG